MSQHTPEPWDDNTHPRIAANGKVLSKTDYYRATVCVNACAGIEDPAAYIADLQARLDLAVNALEKAIVDLRISVKSNACFTTLYYETTLTQIKGGADDSQRV